MQSFIFFPLLKLTWMIGHAFVRSLAVISWLIATDKEILSWQWLINGRFHRTGDVNSVPCQSLIFCIHSPPNSSMVTHWHGFIRKELRASWGSFLVYVHALEIVLRQSGLMSDWLTIYKQKQCHCRITNVRFLFYSNTVGHPPTHHPLTKQPAIGCKLSGAFSVITAHTALYIRVLVYCLWVVTRTCKHLLKSRPIW